MSTHDCPGANPANRDVLAAGAWAEHEDGSLIFVEGTEGAFVVYSIFDTTKSPILEYRDMMPETGFKKQFTWRPGEATGNGKNEKWLWHDKTPMPWNRVIKAGATDGLKSASAHDTLTAAGRVAESLRLRGTAISKHLGHRTDQVRSRTGSIMDKIGRAIGVLPKDRD